MATDLGKVGMRMRGDWNSSTAYEVLDAVSYNGGLYIAKQAVPANTLPTNTTYWQTAISPDEMNIYYVPKKKFYIAANIPTPEELNAISTAEYLVTGAQILEFYISGSNTCRSAIYMNNANYGYGAGLLVSFYESRFYKVVNNNKTWTLTTL